MTGAIDLLATYGGRERVLKAFADRELSPDLARGLLSARSALFGAGNRRRLFARFDALLGSSLSDRAEPAGTEPDAGRHRLEAGLDTAVQLRSLELRNWKVFERALFEFPAFSADRPVVLIGGKNGYGKTSVLEAILFGLYGQRALLDVDRALRADGGGSGSARAASYRQIIDRAFHEPARTRGEGVAVVRIVFDTLDGPFGVERRWFFGEDDRSSDENEVLTLYEGEGLDLVPVPDGEDGNLYYQEEIARRLMPASVAPFFLFDGEQVKRLAERQMADQVRLGVESVLGLHAWRDTAADLRDYARDRARGGLQAEDLGRLMAHAEALAVQQAEAEARMAQLQSALDPLRARRDKVLAELGALTGGTFASMHELHERRHSLSAEFEKLRADLAHNAGQSLPLILVGPELPKRLSATLRHEQTDGRPAETLQPETLDALLLALDAEPPALPKAQRLALHDRVRRAWAQVAGAAEPSAVRHHYLNGRLRGRVLDRLTAGDGGESLGEQIALLRRARADLADIERQIAGHGARDRSDQDLRGTLKGLGAEIDAFESQRRELDQAIGRLSSEALQTANQIDARRSGRKVDEPTQQRADQALRAAQAMEDVIAAVAPICFESFAEAVTRAYTALAHKAVVERVTIDAAGVVALLDRQGRDVRNFDLSAGESQIFAMALIAAVADTARCPMPLVIDTPLGRLDPDHRERILEFFTTQPRQTILLSQPDEVSGRYLDQIRDRIAAQYRLDHEPAESGLGGSVPREGYFSDLAA